MSAVCTSCRRRAGANAIAHALRAWWCATLGRPLRPWDALLSMPL